MQTFPGPERPEAEIAVLESGAGTVVFGIDGVRTRGRSFLLLPGVHEVWLRVEVRTQEPNANWKVWSYCRLGFRALAGERYESRVRTRKELESALSSRLTMEVGIWDGAGRLQSATTGCTPDRPRLAERDDESAAAHPLPPPCEPDLEKWAIVQFDITADGSVENARVLRSCPPGRFDSAVEKAVSGWRYEPTGRRREGERVRLRFDSRP